ncbi:MAG: MFS transporter [Halobacteriota archaeon]
MDRYAVMRHRTWDYRHTVLLAVMAGNFAQFGSRVIISPIVPNLIETFSVSKGTIGFALTAMWAAYALLQFPSGVLADRYGDRLVLVVSMGLVGSGSLLLALSPSFVFFAVFAFFLGAGAGLFLTVGISFVTKLFQNTGQALGLVTTGSGSVGLVGPPIAAFIAVNYGWRAVPLISATVAFSTLVFLLWRVRPRSPQRSETSLSSRISVEMLLRILRRPAIVYTMALAVVINFAFQAFVSFFPVFLTEYWSVSIETASLAFGVVFFGFAAGQPVMGRLSDRLGRDTVIAMDGVAVVAGFSLLLLGSSTVAAVVGVAFLAVGFTWFGVLNARISELFDPSERGTGVGLMRTVFMFLGSLGGVVTGVFADAAGWSVAYGFLVVLVVIVLAAIGLNRGLGLDL